jgi:hypothetical protein
MGTRGRRVLTATVVGLLLVGGCTAGGPRRQPPDPATAGPVTTAPSLPATSLPPPGPAPSTRPADRVLGVVWHGDPAVGNTTATLGWLDATSLRERPGRRLRLGVSGVGWTVAPDQSLALFAAGGDSNDGRLLVVDPRRLRRLGTIRLPSPWWEWPYASSWVGRSRVLLAGSGVIERPERDLSATVVTALDPAARRVVAQRTLPGQLLASARLPDGLVLLLGRPASIGPARVAVVDTAGRARVVSLPGIAAGFQEPADWDVAGASSRRAQPGLAVDPDGRRAFVVGAGTPVAVVDLRSLQVAWHRTEPGPGLLRRLADWLLPAAEAKSVHGPVRVATWLGGGLLAVWGQDETEPVVRGPTVEQWLRPAGLRLVDTRTWRVTTINPHASGAVWAGGRLLAYGRLLGPPAGPDADEPTQRTYGLTVFGPGDRRPVHLFGTRQVNWVEVNGGRAYVDLTPSTDRYVGQDSQATDRVVAVVDLRRARVLAEWRGRLPELLGGSCCVEQAGW